MPEEQRLTIVVTGGSRGIGRAICLAFAEKNADIYFNYFPSQEADEARKTEKMVSEKGALLKGAQAKGFCANVALEEDLSGFFQEILSQTGRIDYLVNNAGITKDALLPRMKGGQWDDVMSVNLKGPFLCMKMAVRTMMKQRFGRIVNISSVTGVIGNAGQANYSASKAGLIGLTKTAAKELGSRGITVNAVAPGFIETDMTETLSDKIKQKFIDEIPLQRAGKPEDVARAVLFLCSENAGYITGQTLHVNGGMYM